MKIDQTVDVVILGAGSAGLRALAEVRKVTENFLVVDPGPHGTTCARIGCMPSKALIQVAHDFHRRKRFAEQGILGGESLRVDSPSVLRHVRTLRDRFVKSAIEPLQAIGDRLIEAKGRFIEPTLLKIGTRNVRTKTTIIATGASPFFPKEWREFEKQILTSDHLFELESFPNSFAVVGTGSIGIEIGQALSRLGVQVTCFSSDEKIGILTDPVLNTLAAKIFGKEFALHLGKKAEVVRSKKPEFLRVKSDRKEVEVAKVLASMGRLPNLDLGLENLKIPFRANGIPEYNRETLQVGALPIFIAGDVNADAPILHEATDEGRIAGKNAVAATPQAYQRFIPLGIVFTDPNIVRIGKSFSELSGTFPIGESEFRYGRAIILSAEGKIRLYADPESRVIVGCEMIGPACEHLAHLVAIFISEKYTAAEALKLPFYHPTLEETLKEALIDLKEKSK